MNGGPMFNWKKWLIPGLATVAVLTVLAVVLRIGPVEADLSARTQDALKPRHGWAQISLSGRDLVLGGTAPSQEAAGQAAALAQDVYGVRAVSGRPDLLPVQAPYRLTVTRSAGGLVIEGFAPDEGTRQALVDIAAATVPGAAVEQKVALAGGAPQTFLPLAGFAIAQLAGLEEGTIDLTDTSLSVKGTAISPRSYDIVTGALEAGLPGGELASVDIAPPTVSPYDWSLGRTEDGVFLEGNVPSGVDRLAIAADIHEAMPGVHLENRLGVAAGLPQGVDWRQATAFMAERLSQLATGTVSVSNGEVSLDGEAASPEAFDALTTVLNRELPAGLTLVSAEIRRPRVDPFVWSVTFDPAGGARLSGYVPDSDTAARLAAAVRAHLSGNGGLVDDQKIASGAPDGFADAGLAAIAAAPRLSGMRAELSGARLSLTGEALTGTAANEIRSAVKAVVPSSFAVDDDIAVSPPGEPLEGEACQSDLAQSLETSSILFEAGSAAIDPASLGLLDRLAFILRRCSDTRFEVGGHTDSDGTEEVNLALSTDRARAVVDRLVRSGVRYSRVTAKGYGESRPVAGNATEQGKAKNRRIEFRIIR